MATSTELPNESTKVHSGTVEDIITSTLEFLRKNDPIRATVLEAYAQYSADFPEALQDSQKVDTEIAEWVKRRLDKLRDLEDIMRGNEGRKRRRLSIKDDTEPSRAIASAPTIPAQPTETSSTLVASPPPTDKIVPTSSTINRTVGASSTMLASNIPTGKHVPPSSVQTPTAESSTTSTPHSPTKKPAPTALVQNPAGTSSTRSEPHSPTEKSIPKASTPSPAAKTSHNPQASHPPMQKPVPVSTISTTVAKISSTSLVPQSRKEQPIPTASFTSRDSGKSNSSPPANIAVTKTKDLPVPTRDKTKKMKRKRELEENKEINEEQEIHQERNHIHHIVENFMYHEDFGLTFLYAQEKLIRMQSKQVQIEMYKAMWKVYNWVKILSFPFDPT